jgi:hypothetical protein
LGEKDDGFGFQYQYRRRATHASPLRRTIHRVSLLPGVSATGP